MTADAYWMEVRDATDAAKLLGWFAVPLDVLRGEAGEFWVFQERPGPSTKYVVTLTLPIRLYRTPRGDEWFAFSANEGAQKKLPLIQGFRKA